MADKLEKAYTAFISQDRRKDFPRWGGSVLLVTLLYLIAVLSVKSDDPGRLIWFGIYPIVAAEISGIGYLRVFVHSLWMLLIVIPIAIFNPIIHQTEAFTIESLRISVGWVEFLCIMIRGLFSYQAVLIMIRTIGFMQIFAGLRHLGVPLFLCGQLVLTYRYIAVVMEEAIRMKRARAARGYGRKTYPFKMWGVMVGQLLIRSMDRAKNIHRAMLARGFRGVLPVSDPPSLNIRAIIWLLGWGGIFILLRFIDIGTLVKIHLLN